MYQCCVEKVYGQRDTQSRPCLRVESQTGKQFLLLGGYIMYAGGMFVVVTETGSVEQFRYFFFFIKSAMECF